MKIYRKLLLWAAVVFGLSRVVVFIAFQVDPYSQWSVLAILFSPFFAPALGGAYVIQTVERRNAKEALLTAAGGAALAFVHAAAGRFLGIRSESLAVHAAFGIGGASIAYLAVRAASARGRARSEWLAILLPASILPTFVAVSMFFLSMTAVLHPTVYDGSVYIADDFFGVQPSFAMGRLFEALPPLAQLAKAVYWGLPLALAFVYAGRRRAGDGEREVLLSFVAVGAIGFVLYHLYPVAGPTYFFGRVYPFSPPALAKVAKAGQVLPLPIPRNCMPSLHTGWALMLYWHARPLPRAARVFALLWLVLTILGTLGFGYHYAMDLVVGVAFAMSVKAGFSAWRNPKDPAARRATYLGAAMTLGWMVLLRFVVVSGTAATVVRLPLALATVVASWMLERALSRPSVTMADDTVSHRTSAASSPVSARLALLIALSGAAASMHAIVYSVQLALAFGSTAGARAGALSAYLAGGAVGALLGGAAFARARLPLRVFGGCQVALALYGVCSHWLFVALRHAYAALGSGIGDVPLLLALRWCLAALVVAVPAALTTMGLPLLAGSAADFRSNGRAVLFSWSTFAWGTAIGALLAGYLTLSSFGPMGTAVIAAVGSLGAALLAIRAPKLVAGPPRETSEPAGRTSNAIALCAAAVVAGGLEVTYAHLLAAVAGDSMYARASMWIASLGGLALGAFAAERIDRRARVSPVRLANGLLVLSAVVLASVQLIDQAPGYFASYATYPIVREFASRELVRFVVCAAILTPPAASIGALATMALLDIARRKVGFEALATGQGAARGFIGGLLGVAASALFVSKIGSIHSLQLWAAFAALSAIAVLATTRAPVRMLIPAAAACVVLAALEPRDFDFDAFGEGASAYFHGHPRGRLIAHAESLDGGTVTVHESPAPFGAGAKSLYVDGHFQGDDRRDTSAASYALLHTVRRGRALVIGLGTGTSAGALVRAGFSAIDVAEPSREVASLVDGHFASPDGAAPPKEALQLHALDGRTALSLIDRTYDLVSIDVPNLWVASAASLYHRELYRLVRNRLAAEGVLEQTVQLHRLTVEDFAAILAAVRSVLPNAWLYSSGAQGVIVACASDCSPTRESVTGVRPAAANPYQLLADRLLSPTGVERLLRQTSATDELVPTDENLFLEYHAPRAAVRNYQASLDENLARLRGFSPSSPAEGTHVPEADVAAGLTNGPGHGKEEK